jgi:beta-lactam-binding protein with PASTA domain
VDGLGKIHNLEKAKALRMQRSFLSVTVVAVGFLVAGCQPPASTDRAAPQEAASGGPGGKSSSAEPRPAAPGEEPAGPGDGPADPGDKPARPGKEPGDAGEKPAGPGEATPENPPASPTPPGGSQGPSGEAGNPPADPGNPPRDPYSPFNPYAPPSVPPVPPGQPEAPDNPGQTPGDPADNPGQDQPSGDNPGKGGAGVAVPNVTNLTYFQAQKSLKQVGLAIQAGNTPAGPVKSQNPVAGTLVQNGTAVKVYFGGKVKVPDVVGLPPGAAKHKIQAAGLTFKLSGSAPTHGVAKAQFPAAGTSVNKGATVSVTFGAKGGHVKVPSVKGASLATAKSKIEGAGLTLVVTNPGAAGAAKAQSPAAGTSVPSGSKVSVTFDSKPTTHSTKSGGGPPGGGKFPPHPPVKPNPKPPPHGPKPPPLGSKALPSGTKKVASRDVQRPPLADTSPGAGGRSTTASAGSAQHEFVFLLDHVHAPAPAGLPLRLAEPGRAVQVGRGLQGAHRPEDDPRVPLLLAEGDGLVQEPLAQARSPGARLDQEPA